MSVKRLRIAVFASGRGSNFTAIAEAADRGTLKADIGLLVVSDPEAGAIAVAESFGIPVAAVCRKEFDRREAYVTRLIALMHEHDIDFIALAGYMKKIPPELISLYAQRITNIHPGLLPAFGGRGMYGRHVHEAVLDYGCKVTGVTIHLVDEHYDHGPVIAQECVPVLSGDTPEVLAKRVLEVEHRLYPAVLACFADGRVRISNNRVEILPEKS
ncbi:phosphoribosylglycinamide formyltransferase [bacterium]|nr:phosphoribosylglycinamide formyltransferase [bacterium]